MFPETVSVGYLLLSQEPLAKRAICLGGCPPLLGQLPVFAADKVAQTAIDALGLDGVPTNEVVQLLLNIPVEEFWAKLPPSIPFLPVIDGDIIMDRVTLESFSQGLVAMAENRVDSIMVGTCELDVSHDQEFNPTSM